jgi:hypothetical protein
VKLLNWLASKWKRFDIVKEVDGEKVLYLRRYFVWRSKYFNVFLHNIVRPDEDPDPHDHPWSFTSVVLRGGYTEQRFVALGTSKTDYKFWGFFETRNAPSIGFRDARTIHQIVFVKPGTWTLVFTGPVKREWGFWTEGGWKFWREYLNVWDKVEMD